MDLDKRYAVLHYDVLAELAALERRVGEIERREYPMVAAEHRDV